MQYLIKTIREFAMAKWLKKSVSKELVKSADRQVRETVETILRTLTRVATGRFGNWQSSSTKWSAIAIG
ncbi:hypothetical protein AO069_27205 [Pseudomonas syringae pv. syringae PD2774]|nr:hypothetical protein AO069_27205 [Pseudomonas syringae pv. syringae PD2774]